MVETAKDVTVKVLRETWPEKGKINVVRESSNLVMSIIMSCVFGEKNSNPIVS